MARKILAAFTRLIKARPDRCPYCESTDIDTQNGWAECRDCGATWSY